MPTKSPEDTLAVMLVLLSNQQHMMEQSLLSHVTRLTRQIAHLEDAVRRLTVACEAATRK